jgi:elongation factor Ts
LLYRSSDAGPRDARPAAILEGTRHMEITAAQVKALRDKTGAGMMECKAALQGAGGDQEKAIENLRKKGLASAAKRAGRTTSNGVVGSYIHMGGKVGVLVEVNCETDFVARTEEFRDLVKHIAMHIAAANPLAVTAEEIPGDIVEREKAVFLEQVKSEGKPEKIWDRIVEGKLKKFYQDNALVDQIYVKDPEGKQSIGQLITETSARTGERFQVRRFARFALGE